MNAFEAAQIYLQGLKINPIKSEGLAFAPANIALIKYWGKRNTDLNLPMNSSLSISMGDQGAYTKISVNPQGDQVIFNDKPVFLEHIFAKKIIAYLNILDPRRPFLKIETSLNIPPTAGLASSAAGFSALILALNDLCEWRMPLKNLSCLARLGSGSACRSLWSGFVEWHKGSNNDGTDCFAEPLPETIKDLRLGLLIVEECEKKISSREGMLQTVQTSPLYRSWPENAENDLILMKAALKCGDFEQLGSIAEHNALMMHATMMAARPSIVYSTPQTLEAMHKIWQLRREGIHVYFTQDAGPNLKLLFEESTAADLLRIFLDLRVIIP